MSASLINRSRATMIAAAGAVALSMVAVGGAQAAPAAPAKCTIKSYTPKTFVVSEVPTEKTFKVKTTGCTQKSWRIDVVDEDGTKDLLVESTKPVVTLEASDLVNEIAGRYRVVVTVKSTDNVTTKKKSTFALLRKATFGTSFDAGPEPTTKGAELTLVGTLKRVSWGENPVYKGFANRPVEVQFRAAGTKTFTKVKSVKTNADGQVSTTVTADAIGDYRLHFAAGTTTSAANSRADTISFG
jgi:hypothetical protein